MSLILLKEILTTVQFLNISNLFMKLLKGEILVVIASLDKRLILETLSLKKIINNY